MIKQLGPSDFKNMPWKNGSGITTELYKIPSEHDADFNFRLSVAKITQDSPFSIFQGIDRHMLILEGTGVQLFIPNKHLKITDDGQYFSFRGEDKIDSKLLEGPVTDFNVMTRRNWGESTLHLSDHEKYICKSHHSFIYQHTSPPSLWVLDKGDEMNIDKPSIIVELKINIE